MADPPPDFTPVTLITDDLDADALLSVDGHRVERREPADHPSHMLDEHNRTISAIPTAMSSN
jgi:hypothetical protein